MLPADQTAVQDINTEAPTLGGIELLNMIHDLLGVLDGTRRYVKLLTSEIPESDPLRVYAESVQAGLDRISDIQTAMLDSIRSDFLLLPKS